MGFKAAVANLEKYGAKVAVFGLDVWVSVPTHADLLVLAVFHGVDIKVVVTQYGVPVAADAIEYSDAGYRWHVQGPTRKPNTNDWARMREHEAEVA